MLVYRSHGRVHGEQAVLAGARHGDVEQPLALLQLKPGLALAHGKPCARSGISCAHIVRIFAGKPRAGASQVLLELLRHVIALDVRTVRRARRGKLAGQRDQADRAVIAAQALQLGVAGFDGEALRHGDNRELQALAGVHRHDAHRVAAFLVERAGGLLALQEPIVGKGDLARRGAQLSLRLRDGIQGLEHVGGAGAALRPLAGQANHPAGLAGDRGKGVAAHAGKRGAQHGAGAVHQRQVAQAVHVLIAHEAGVYVAAAGLTRLLVLRGRQGQKLLRTQREHVARQQRRQALHGIRKVCQRPHQRADSSGLLCLGEDRTARDDAVEPLGAEGVRVHVGTRHAAKQQDHAAHGLARVRQLAEAAGDGLGAGLGALLRATARNQQGLTTVHAGGDHAVLAAIVRLQVEEALHKTAAALGRAVEDGCHVIQDLGMAAEVLDQLHHAAGV